jgi:cytochrome b
MNRDDSSRTRTIRVWDPLVRVGHWLLVTSVLTAWLTRHSPGRWHEWLGYAALAVVAVRFVWGWVGTQHARFADFVRGPRATLSYARMVLTGREPRTLGHNPLGGWMVVALLTTVALVCATGWLYTTDRFWGVEWVETVHSWLSDALLVLIALHVAGVLYTSFHHRENLIAAMLHGRKQATSSTTETHS